MKNKLHNSILHNYIVTFYMYEVLFKKFYSHICTYTYMYIMEGITSDLIGVTFEKGIGRIAGITRLRKALLFLF